jgi:alpha-ribazole phosphatase
VELYLIRHTLPDIPAGICYGRSDIGLASSFESEAREVRRKFGIPPELVYSSPSQRCLKLAQFLSQGWGCRPVEDARLMELHFGEWEMKGWHEISMEALERWGASYIHEPPPGGETYVELHQRAQSFLVELNDSEAASVAVVTHAGVIRALLAEATGKALSETFDFELDYGGVTRLQCHGGKLQLISLND